MLVSTSIVQIAKEQMCPPALNMYGIIVSLHVFSRSHAFHQRCVSCLVSPSSQRLPRLSRHWYVVNLRPLLSGANPAVCIFFTAFHRISHLNANPHDANNNIHTPLFTSLILVTPHAIFLIVPVCASCRVHAASACRAFGGCFGRGLSWARVLDNGRVDHVFVGRRCFLANGGGRGCGFGD
jgi:hypothetical protein